MNVFAEPALCAGQHQRRGELVVVAQPSIGAQQPADVLARFDGADEEDKFLRQIPQRLNVLACLGAIERLVKRIRAFIDHRYLILADTQHAHQVVLGALRHGDDLIGAAHRAINLAVVARGFLGQEMRVDQEGQVVNGDHRTAARMKRRDEIRAVEDVGFQAVHHQGQKVLLQPVMARDTALGNGDIVCGDCGRGVAGVLQQGETVCGVGRGEGTGQTQGVLTDAGAGVVNQSRVNGDMHVFRWPPTLTAKTNPPLRRENRQGRAPMTRHSGAMIAWSGRGVK